MDNALHTSLNESKRTVPIDSVHLERGGLKKAGEYFDLSHRVFIVTDSGVPAEYAAAVLAQCAKARIHIIPAGEPSKSFSELQRLLSAMLEFNMDRSDCVVAVGGGVVGDLAGFAASCYMRGVDFYNVPTTLLAQVDSSVGGKTGIDFNGIKNAVGAFYQPKGVIIDGDVLKTLDKRLLGEGIAESIKMALTCDRELFEAIESGIGIDELTGRSLQIKMSVVERDGREKGLRRVLNFGHTVGHAIEAHNGGRLLHGECVALGMLPMCSEKVRERLIPVLKKYELPTEITDSAEALLPYIIHDKKLCADGINTVFVNKIGSFEFERLTVDEIKARLVST